MEERTNKWQKNGVEEYNNLIWKEDIMQTIEVMRLDKAVGQDGIAPELISLEP